MTKKDYVLIAEVIRREYVACDQTTNSGQAMAEATKDVAYSLAEALKKENARFDYSRFAKACGIVEES